MCGICGFAGPGDESALAAMNGRMAHRGPDGQGTSHHPRHGLHLGHRRLAIVDIVSGAQPMATLDGGLCVTFNGEIYNHQELRRELEAKGHRFQTSHCDTEVLLHGYREWGQGLTERLSGMWAFALYDAERGELFLSRDRFGKKPLYYHLRAGFMAFASELSALLEHPEVPAGLDHAALKKYFAYGFIPAPGSLYAGVRKLPGGCNLLVNLDDFSSRLSRYWTYRIEPFHTLPTDPEAVWGEQIRELLDKAVARRLMSDVPLGVFLSGGIDSSAITALAARRVAGRRLFPAPAVSLQKTRRGAVARAVLPSEAFPAARCPAAGGPAVGFLAEPAPAPGPGHSRRAAGQAGQPGRTAHRSGGGIPAPAAAR
jgi:asparagine synthase (glutamine-hydrolysing)